MPRRPRNGFCLQGHRDVRQGLVAADVEGPQRDRAGRPSASAIASYSACCSSTSGAELRPRKRNSVRTRPAPSAPAASAAGRRPPIRRWRQPRSAIPSRDTAGSLREREVLRPALGQVRGPPLELLQQLRRGIDVQLAGAAVQDDLRAFRDAEHVATGRHDKRDVARPGQDRGMRARHCRRPAPHLTTVGVQPGRLRGRQVAGDEHTFGHRLPGGAPVRARSTWSPTARTSSARSRR